MSEIVDVTKCIGCRKGVILFLKATKKDEKMGGIKEGEFYHIDLFATPEAGESYKCENSGEIDKYLVYKEENKTWLPNEELEEFLGEQGNWWNDAVALAFDVFEDDKDRIAEFFNDGEEGKRVWNMSNKEIEDKLVELAKEKGVRYGEYENLYVNQEKEGDEDIRVSFLSGNLDEESDNDFITEMRDELKLVEPKTEEDEDTDRGDISGQGDSTEDFVPKQNKEVSSPDT